MIIQETKLVKTWGGFNLAILKVKSKSTRKNQSSYNKTYKLPRSTSYYYPLVDLLTRPRASSESTDSFFLWPLQNTNTHVCDFEIPLKGLATQTLLFVTSRPPLKV